MALVDVTELLVDPDFVDAMQVITRFPAVSSLGENFMKEVVRNSVGSIQSASGRDVRKLPEAMQQENVSTFWFKGEIIASATCKYSSVLVFKGTRYQVRHVNDWSNWGAGWTEGLCVAERPS